MKKGTKAEKVSGVHSWKLPAAAAEGPDKGWLFAGPGTGEEELAKELAKTEGRGNLGCTEQQGAGIHASEKIKQGILQDDNFWTLEEQILASLGVSLEECCDVQSKRAAWVVCCCFLLKGCILQVLECFNPTCRKLKQRW